MNNNEIEYDRDKDRQGLFEEVFFKKLYSDNLWLMNKWINETEADSNLKCNFPQQKKAGMRQHTAFPARKIAYELHITDPRRTIPHPIPVPPPQHQRNRQTA